MRRGILRHVMGQRHGSKSGENLVTEALVKSG